MRIPFICTWCVFRFWTAGGSTLSPIRIGIRCGLRAVPRFRNRREAGWKDTVRADPGMMTRIIIPFEGYVGRYVWHCHILEHEDNEMMRPYEVIAAR